MNRDREAVKELIYRSCTALDSKDFKGYLDLCDSAYVYMITAYSPEILKEMIWLRHDKEGMQTLFNTLHKHNTDHSELTRHATVYTIAFDEQKQQATVMSALQVFRTTLDGGVTELFAVGKLHDTVAVDDTLRLLSRNVRLDTRMLGIGHHIPF